jgi:nitroreductase
MDLATAIDTRSSAVRLTEPPPSQSDIERILAAGIRVPDHGRLAPARFVILQKEGCERFGKAIAAAFLKKHPTATPQQLAGERDKAFRAPTIIVVAARVLRDHKVPPLEQMISVAAGVQNMFLTAHSLGYGVMWKTGAAAYDPEVNVALGLSPNDQIIAFLYLGTIAAMGPRRSFTLDGVVDWL